MLKKVLFILSFVFVLTSCINLSDNGDSYEYEIIDSEAIITKYMLQCRSMRFLKFNYFFPGGFY